MLLLLYSASCKRVDIAITYADIEWAIRDNWFPQAEEFSELYQLSHDGFYLQQMQNLASQYGENYQNMENALLAIAFNKVYYSTDMESFMK